ncbi:MAG: DEAD/DEAH box helicase [Planctomycetota bacterium]
MPTLRPYQARLYADIATAWANGIQNVLAVAPTGSGKTVIFSEVIANHVGAACVIAHRQELVSQISISLTHAGVRHTIIAPRKVVKIICRMQVDECGVCLYDPSASVAVAGVDTLVRRGPRLNGWREQVTLWVQDEAHHLLRENKWGTAVELFPNARGLGVTATPCRADGKGLGRDADGVFDLMINGPSMRDLIGEGFLTDYTIFSPGSDVDTSAVAISDTTGDFNKYQLRAAVRKSHLVGGVVDHYIKHAGGLRGVTFATDVETCHELAAEYIRKGVPAAAVSAKTPEDTRNSLVQRFRRGELLQLVNVDLFGEGFDLPAICCVSFARPTHSYSVFTQQFGRALRLTDGKHRAIIIDHVDNVVRHHGPPDLPRPWTLDRRERSARGARDPDIVPQKVCIWCTQPFEAVYKLCPHCGEANEPGRRDGPEFVEGDLIELDAATIAAMRQNIEQVDETPEALFQRLTAQGLPGYMAAGQRNRRTELHAAQGNLRQLLALYGGLQHSRGRNDSEAQRRFYFRYGVDVMTAQSYSRKDAEQLACKLIDDISRGAA